MNKVLPVLLSLLLAACSTAQKTSVPPGALDPELTQFSYPFPVSFFETTSQRQNVKMAYMDVAAAKPNGRAVLLLHGKNFSGAYWASTIRYLSERGFRVIAPDQIGFGKSSKLESYQFTFEALASNTMALLQHLNVGHVSVIGHSMGGMLAVRFERMFPHAVERLALVNPIGLEDWRLHVPYKTIAENFAQELKTTPESIKEYQRMSYFAGEWKPEYDSLIEIPVGWVRHPQYARIAWNSALTSDMVFTQPVLYEFEKIQARTLLIIGLRDRTAIGRAAAPPEVAKQLGNYPLLGRAASKRIRHAQLAEIANAGHLPQVETFEAYSRALESFLTK